MEIEHEPFNFAGHGCGNPRAEAFGVAAVVIDGGRQTKFSDDRLFSEGEDSVDDIAEPRAGIAFRIIFFSGKVKGRDLCPDRPPGARQNACCDGFFSLEERKNVSNEWEW